MSEVADDLYALKHWLETFPEFCNSITEAKISDNKSNSNWIDDFENSIGILHALEEVLESLSLLPIKSQYVKKGIRKDEQKNRTKSKFENSNEVWNYISSNLLPNIIHDNESNILININCKVSLLSEALCYTMTNKCTKKEVYIRRILNMDDGSIQRALMKIIENGLDRVKQQQEQHEQQQQEQQSEVETNNETFSQVDCDNNNNQGFATKSANTQHQQQQIYEYPSSITRPTQCNEKKRKLSYESSFSNNELDCSFTSEISDTSMISPPTKHQRRQRRRTTSLDTKEQEENYDNKFKNLENELNQARNRESDLIEQLETLRSQYRGIQLDYESNSMDRERQIKEQYKKDIEHLHSELEQHKLTQGELEDTKHKLVLLTDEVDCLKHCERKLGEAEHRVQNLRDRLEDIGDAKSALIKEEEAHGNAVNEIIRLENELSVLQPLRRQLEDYKIRATDAEVQLIEYQEKLTKVNDDFDMMKGVNHELKKLATCRQENADSMKQIMMLRQEDLFANDGTHGIGEGITELNPDIQEELLRLRNENTRLREFVDKRSEDSVEKMEGNLDDSQRLASKLKSEFLSTKARLELTIESLQQSIAREEALQNDVKILKEEVNNLEQKLKKESDQRIEDKDSAKRELQSTKESLLHQHKVELENEHNSWSKKLEEEKENTKKKMKHSAEEKAAMSKQWFETLADEQANYEDRLETAAIEYEQKEQELKNKVEMERQISVQKLQEAADEHHKLNMKWEEDMSKEKDNFKSDIEKMGDMQREKEVKWKQALDEEINDKEMRLEEAEVKSKELEVMFSNSMEQHKNQATQDLQHVKLEYEEKITALIMKEKQKIEDVIRNGKNILKQEKKKYEVLTNEFNEFKQIYKKNEEKATTKLSALKRKLTTEKEKSSDLESQNLNLEEDSNKLRREKIKLQEENDRFRRLMANSHSDGTASQSEMNKLIKEYDSMLQENKKLRKEIAERENISNDSNSVFYANNLQPFQDNNHFNTTATSTKASTLSHVRNEYDHRVQKLTEEKRELIRQRMTSDISLNTLKQKYNSVEEELVLARNEITTLNLALERNTIVGDNKNSDNRLSSNKNPKSGNKNKTTSTNYSRLNASNTRRALYPTITAMNNINESKVSPIPDLIIKDTVAVNKSINKENIEYNSNRNNISFSKSRNIGTPSNHVKLPNNENKYHFNTKASKRQAIATGSSTGNNDNLVQRNINNRKQPTLVDLSKSTQPSEPGECQQS